MDLKSAQIERETIESLRVLIYEHIHKCGDKLQVDLADVHNRIAPPEEMLQRSGDADCNNANGTELMLRRFIHSAHQSGQSLEVAVKLFVDTFQFRARHQVAQLTVEKVIPLEFYHIQPFIIGGFDREGNKLFIVRARFYRKLAQFDVLIKRAFLYLMEQYDLELERGEYNGSTVIIDLAGYDYWNNVDLGLLRFLYHGLYYYRGALGRVLLNAFPWAITWLLKLVESWIMTIKGYHDRKLFHLVNEANIDQYVEADQRPEFLYGTRPGSMKIPPEVVPLAEMLKQDELRGVISDRNGAAICAFIQELMNQVESGRS